MLAPVKQTKRDRAGLGQSIQGAAPWKSALAAGNKPFSRKWHSGHFQVDANHDGVMDNRDLTSVNNPMQFFWVNNDCDRWHAFDFGTDMEQDDLSATDLSTPFHQDCFFVDLGLGPEIPCTRDLEDYARLWITASLELGSHAPNRLRS